MSGKASHEQTTGLLRFERAGTTLTATIRDGAGIPLIVLPGVMADAATWQPVVDHIDLPNPVVTVNRRGRVPSGPLGANYSVGVEIADLHRILDEVGGEVHLFGWSYGGLIAVETALERSTIRSLIAYEPVATPFAPTAIAPLRAAIERDDLDRAVEIVNTDVSGFSAEYVADPRRSPIWPVLRPLAASLGEEMAAINHYRPRLGSYQDLSIPVTLLLGELNDSVAPYGTAFARIAAALPQAEIVCLPGQGHLAHAQAPELLARHITNAVTALSTID
ncbi:alpha/beta fold hydrolase [Nocardia goodfellowii]|uniref:Pimeloyl-ACP methyl ester carboxylesterase n=1 Tax=Nocardia goodfellowii TaxID=882446 RepID=A0ABS4QIM1_9NOCA|nr:alpha/beta hydrolase [Nocardia goodfellowii]MBP2191541.1 pimeloyl-ACP methyl ester carboxylesterase [Nocardia goodfellowii]